MTVSTSIPPQLFLVSTPSRIEDCPTSPRGDGSLVRLSIWLAEVSAEAAHDAAARAAGAAPAAMAPPEVVGVPPAPKVVR